MSPTLDLVLKALHDGAPKTARGFRAAGYERLYRRALAEKGSWTNVLAALAVDYEAVTSRVPRGALTPTEVRRRVAALADSLQDRRPTARDFRDAGLTYVLRVKFSNNITKALTFAKRGAVARRPIVSGWKARKS